MTKEQRKNLYNVKKRYDERRLDYGVKGMKWGHHKAKKPEPSDYKSVTDYWDASREYSKQVIDSYISEDQKIHLQDPKVFSMAAKVGEFEMPKKQKQKMFEMCMQAVYGKKAIDGFNDGDNNYTAEDYDKGWEKLDKAADEMISNFIKKPGDTFTFTDMGKTEISKDENGNYTLTKGGKTETDSKKVKHAVRTMLEDGDFKYTQI